MKTRSNPGAALLAGIFCAALAACGGAPTFGDQVISQGKGTSAIGSDWNDGEEMVAKGQKLEERGHDEVAKGQRDIAEGREMVARGRARMAEAEQEFKNRPQ